MHCRYRGRSCRLCLCRVGHFRARAAEKRRFGRPVLRSPQYAARRELVRCKFFSVITVSRRVRCYVLNSFLLQSQSATRHLAVLLRRASTNQEITSLETLSSGMFFFADKSATWLLADTWYSTMIRARAHTRRGERGRKEN